MCIWRKYMLFLQVNIHVVFLSPMKKWHVYQRKHINTSAFYTSRVILSPLPSVMAKTRVSSLINPELNLWKSEVVNCAFLPHEPSMILSIQLSRRSPPDCVSWLCTPFGEFSTSSAYKLLAASALAELASRPTRPTIVAFGNVFGRCRCLTR